MAKQSKQKQKLKGGLSSLLGGIGEDMMKTEEIVKELSHTVAMILMTEIEVNPHQPRNQFDEVELAELARSIDTFGLIQPITVRRLPDEKEAGKFTYQIISGERRFRASKQLGLEEIPAYIRLANDHEMMEMALVENIERADLNPIEIATTYERLKIEFKLTDKQLSERVEKKRSTISNYLGLLKLPPDIQKALKEGKISTGHGKSLNGVDDIILQSALFKQTVEEGLSVRALEAKVRALKAEKDTSPKKKLSLPEAYENVRKDLSDFLETNISLKVNDKGKGQIISPFQDTAALNRILELMKD
ncbi:MAG: ParB/RepB/Spo0J family partition protein [Bacteroidota bacterium]